MIERRPRGAPWALALFASICLETSCATVPARQATETSAAKSPRPTSPARTGDESERHGIVGVVRAAEDNSVEMSFDFAGEPADLTELSLVIGGPDTLGDLTLHDALGKVPYSIDTRGRGAVLTTSRSPQSPLGVAYRLLNTPAGFQDLTATSAGPDRLRVSGETAFLLPSAFDEVPINARIRFELPRVPGASVASSFAARHPERFSCLGRELRHASFLVGTIRRARFDTAEGVDEWAWIDELGFDARPVAADSAVLRSDLARYFEGAGPQPFVTLALADVREDRGFSMASRSRGLLMELSIDAGFNAAVRVAHARELMRPWFGGELRMVAASGAPTEKELWFNEGVARALAGQLSFRFGMLDTEEYLSEVNGLLQTLLLSRYRDSELDAIASRVTGDSEARTALVARGALYVLALEGALRVGDDHPFDTVWRDLFARARQRKAGLGLSDWFDVVESRAGARSREEYQSLVVKGRIPRLAANSLGPCYRLGVARYQGFDLGFDAAASRTEGKGIVGLEPKGPAARAGARATDTLVRLHYQDGDASRPVRIELSRNGQPVSLEYLPVGRSEKGPAWFRREGASSARCR